MKLGGSQYTMFAFPLVAQLVVYLLVVSSVRLATYLAERYEVHAESSIHASYPLRDIITNKRKCTDPCIGSVRIPRL